MKKLALTLAAAVAAVVLTACGGGGGDSTPRAMSADVTLAADSKTTGAVVDEEFTFATPPAEFGTAGSTTVTFLTDADSPTFRIRSAGGTATGVTTFGSCIFSVTASDFPAGHALATGAVVTVDPCSLVVRTAGLAAGASEDRGVLLVLGTAQSAPNTVTVAVDTRGRLMINGDVAATVTLSPVTGS